MVRLLPAGLGGGGGRLRTWPHPSEMLYSLSLGVLAPAGQGLAFFWGGALEQEPLPFVFIKAT